MIRLTNHIRSKLIWRKPEMQRALAINAKTLINDYNDMPAEMREYLEGIVKKI